MASLWEKEGESGLIDNFAFTITKAWFGTNEKYRNGERYLITFEGTTDSLDVPIATVWYGVGKEWISKDGGETLVHEGGNTEKYFNKQTDYYKVIRRCVDDFGMAELLEERGANPFHASSWVGLTFQMKNEERDSSGMTDDDGNPTVLKPKLMPVEFLGVNGGAQTPSAAIAASTASTASANASETPQQKMARLKAEKKAKEAGGTLRDQVIAVLAQHDSFDAAQTAALEIEGVMDDDDLLAELMDEAGLYSEVKASA